MSYNIIRESKGSYKKFFGHVTGAELLQSVFENIGDPEFDRMRYTINDLLDIESHAITAKSFDIAITYGLRAAQRNPTRRVAVVTNDPLIQHQIFAYLNRDQQLAEVFDQLKNARDWVKSP
jgi:hypothetical protein